MPHKRNAICQHLLNICEHCSFILLGCYRAFGSLPALLQSLTHKDRQRAMMICLACMSLPVEPQIVFNCYASPIYTMNYICSRIFICVECSQSLLPAVRHCTVKLRQHSVLFGLFLTQLSCNIMPVIILSTHSL